MGFWRKKKQFSQEYRLKRCPPSFPLLFTRVVGWEGPPVEEGAGLCEGAYEATTGLEMVQE